MHLITGLLRDQCGIRFSGYYRTDCTNRGLVGGSRHPLTVGGLTSDMASPQRMTITVVGIAFVLGCASVVYRDATQNEVSRPPLWAGVIVVAWGSALGLYLAPLTVPIPGLLIMVVGGLALYLFERGDATHADEPADPFSLPDGPGDSSHDNSRNE